MLIADSQIHVWKEETSDRPWVPGARERMRSSGHRVEPFTYEAALEEMGKAGVHRACIVPPSWEGNRIDYGCEAAEKYPDRFCVMARLPQNDAKEGKAMMRDYRSIPGVKGVRLTFLRPNELDGLNNGTCAWIWPLAEELGLPIMVHAPTLKLELGKIATQHPKLKLIVDHMGILSHSVDDTIKFTLKASADLHIYPNIYVKLSAAPTFSTHPYPYENITPYVKDCVTAMGANRCFWGTDVTRVIEAKNITYRQCVEHFTRHMGFTDAELSEIMGNALCDTIGWVY